MDSNFRNQVNEGAEAYGKIKKEIIETSLKPILENNEALNSKKSSM